MKNTIKANPYSFFQKKTKDINGKIIFVSGDVKQFVERLDSSNRNIWLLGGASIVNEFLKNDLIDEYIITIIPILLGSGISLFGCGLDEKTLKFIEVKNFDMGVVQIHYHR